MRFKQLKQAWEKRQGNDSKHKEDSEQVKGRIFATH